jgi:hypothetical protein
MLIDLKASLIRVERLHGASKAIDRLKDDEFKVCLLVNIKLNENWYILNRVALLSDCGSSSSLPT